MITVLAAIAAISGAIVAARNRAPSADLLMWTFADSHATAYRDSIAAYEKSTALHVSLELLAPRAEDSRLESIFMSNHAGEGAPDIAEIEIGQVGKFFRPPAEEIGFLPLNAFLDRDRLRSQFLPTRLAAWTRGGEIFGIPHDVHPVALAYRKDLFDEAGVDLSAAKTWPEFREACLLFQNFWRRHGNPDRHAMELSRSAADDLTILLLQRGVELVDAQQRIHIGDPRVTQTLASYALMIAGPDAIAIDTNGQHGEWASDFVAGRACAWFMPDWRVAEIRTFAPQLTGKIRLMPLPKFEPSDSPTSTWGGTMIGILRTSKHPEESWKLIREIYLSDDSLRNQRRDSDILPAVPDAWREPSYQKADAFFGGQNIGALYADLAAKIPARHVSPLTPIAEAELAVVLSRAVSWVETHGDDGLENECQRLLNFAASDLSARAIHGGLNVETP